MLNTLTSNDVYRPIPKECEITKEQLRDEMKMLAYNYPNYSFSQLPEKNKNEVRALYARSRNPRENIDSIFDACCGESEKEQAIRMQSFGSIFEKLCESDGALLKSPMDMYTFVYGALNQFKKVSDPDLEEMFDSFKPRDKNFPKPRGMVFYSEEE